MMAPSGHDNLAPHRKSVWTTRLQARTSLPGCQRAFLLRTGQYSLRAPGHRYGDSEFLASQGGAAQAMRAASSAQSEHGAEAPQPNTRKQDQHCRRVGPFGGDECDDVKHGWLGGGLCVLRAAS